MMPCKLFAIYIFLTLLVVPNIWGQTSNTIAITSSRNVMDVYAGKVVNLAFFVENISNRELELKSILNCPQGWRVISSESSFKVLSGDKKFFVFSVQVPAGTPVDKYKVTLSVVNNKNNNEFERFSIDIRVKEVENIDLFLVHSPEYVVAGDEFTAELAVRNMGNTEKRVFLETRNCMVEGPDAVVVKPGESVNIKVSNKTIADLVLSKKEYFTVRALVSGKVVKSIFNPIIIFPSGDVKKDLFFRYPITASATYLGSNESGKYQHTGQFEVYGDGNLDPTGNHHLEFLARGPDNSKFSYFGMYDQYFISYKNKNLELFTGQKSFSFTPLTESSRYGLGAESKVIFNNGLNIGFLYVKPRFFGDIKNEMAAYSGFDINSDNHVKFIFVSKKEKLLNNNVNLFSVSTQFKPFKRSTVELELSRGGRDNTYDNAYMVSANSNFFIFNLTGSYYYSGKNYPGYYTNSKFYFGNVSMNLSPKISIGVYAKEDFRNAKLDTFFVTAPYSRSLRASLNYNIAPRTYFRFFWRDYERKDRLKYNKFHYETNSVNAQFSRRIKHFDYNILGEYGKTNNYLLKPGKNQQDMYRGSMNITYRFNKLHAVRVFGTWSNINNFISEEQRNLIAGMSVFSRITEKIKANFHLQNAYNIDDYYRDRNLMRLNIDYKPAFRHKFSFRSYYTLFRRKTEKPTFNFSVNYECKLGVPLKKVVKAGDIIGRVVRDNGEPVVGLVLSLQGKNAVTDKNGEYSFRAISTGSHFLNIDHSKLAIDELTSIPEPIKVLVVEDRENPFNLVITKGAKVSGQISLVKGDEEQEKVMPKMKNIILEIKSDRQQFRVVTDGRGRFSFPLLRPGQWNFKVYEKSLPGGYEVESVDKLINLQPGFDREIKVSLKKKKREIIFKTISNGLSEANSLNVKALKTKAKINNRGNKDVNELETIFSVQIGAFRKKLNKNSKFFSHEEPYDFEKQIDNLFKYYIGEFLTYEEAENKRDYLGEIYEDPFVVRFENGKFKCIEYRVK